MLLELKVLFLPLNGPEIEEEVEVGDPEEERTDEDGEVSDVVDDEQIGKHGNSLFEISEEFPDDSQLLDGGFILG